MTSTTSTGSMRTIPAGSWYVNQAASEVFVHLRTAWGMRRLRVRFDRFSGTLRVRQDGDASGALTVEAGSVCTGGTHSAAVARSRDFLGVTTHPLVTVAITATASGPEGLTLIGTLAVKDSILAVCVAADAVIDARERLRMVSAMDLDLPSMGMSRNPLGHLRRDARLVLDLVLEREGAQTS